MRKIGFFIFYFLFFIFTHPVYAEKEKYFSSSYDVKYQIAETGITTVTYQITLTNLTSNFYVDKYTIIIGEKEINNIEAFDRLGNLAKDIKKTEDQTEITVNFNDQIVGVNNSVRWTLKYNSNEIAKKNGNIWEVNIPRLSPNSNIDQYQLTLIPALALGKPSLIKPFSSNFTWNKEDLEKSGINIVFGNEQYYTFSFDYDINNSKPFPVISEINIPADNTYQQIYLEKINPSPENIIQDTDGNWLARYRLNPLQKIKVTVSGSAKILLESRLDKETIKDNYLSSAKYWDVDNIKIKEIANQLKTPEKIFEYVVNTLNYDYARSKNILNRYGALKSLSEPNHAVCMEFTDLFITLTRAAGIPSRELAGFAYTQNKKLKPSELLHSWPEYYDQEKRTWIMVDPTWEKTTGGIDYFYQLDLNHFTFVVHGKESDYPYTPDNYQVTPINKFPNSQEKTSLLINLPDKAYSGLPIEGTIQIVNNGNMTIYDKKVIINIENGILETPYEYTIDTLPPLAYQKLDIKIKPDSFFLSKNVKFTVITDKNIKDQTILVKPHILLIILPIIVLVLIISIMIVYIHERNS